MDKVNPNYIHSCGETKTSIKANYKALTDMGFSEKEVISLFDFFLLKAPVQKSNSKSEFGLKSLKDYGWFGNSGKNGLTALEGLLLKSSRIASFCMIKSDSITETLKSMDLSADKICIAHPRAVMMQNSKVSINEAGVVSVACNETRMECLFRHIRNSLAHGCTYQFDNENILLEDRSSDDKQITARILLPKDTLLVWMRIIKKEPEDEKATSEENVAVNEVSEG